MKEFKICQTDRDFFIATFNKGTVDFFIESHDPAADADWIIKRTNRSYWKTSDWEEYEDPEEAYNEFILYEFGIKVIADEEGIYPMKMNREALTFFGIRDATCWGDKLTWDEYYSMDNFMLEFEEYVDEAYEEEFGKPLYEAFENAASNEEDVPTAYQNYINDVASELMLVEIMRSPEIKEVVKASYKSSYLCGKITTQDVRDWR